MPIVSISKIQHRYGLSDNGPSNSSTLQLSAAELGWEIDTRRLFIGNGPISEGAPTIGNTEILTEHSDILGVSNSYQYKGEAAGYVAVTGVDANNPTTRTLQGKLDDFASVKDFGAVGDGVTDDTAAINRAFFELFCRQIKDDGSSLVTEESRRSLFFPAGVYLVTDTIKIPTYAKVYGEGKNSTIIRQTTATPGFAFADSKQQIGGDIGNDGATIPSFIEINDISFESTVSYDGSTIVELMQISLSQNCIFRRVGLKGNETFAPVQDTEGSRCVGISSSGAIESQNIFFEQCDLTNSVYGLLIDDNVQGILLNACRFDTLHKGVNLGENKSDVGPRAVKITNSIFDNVFNAGIHAFDVSGIVSSYNYFNNVGEGDSFRGPYNIVIFEADGNATINDIFERSDADDAVVSRINIDGKSVYALNSADGIYYGYHKTEAGKSVTLNDNTSVAVSSGITFDSANEKTNLIYYTATRGSNVRHGILRITASASGSTLTDEYSEDGADIGLTFSVSVASSTTTLNYTTTSTGNNVTFKYRVERLT